MQEIKFGLNSSASDELMYEIAEAVKEWHLSALEYERLLARWHAETDEQEKQSLWEK